jgi:fimbrial chaperone protein
VVIGRILVAAAAIAIAPLTATAQTGGIQVAPVLVSMNAERNITSVRIRNGRDRAVGFEVDAYAWTQINGQDDLAATRDLLIAPGVFEIPAGGEQILRLGVRDFAAMSEHAYRIILRELPRPHRDGTMLGFTLEMSLPVFVTPRAAAPDVQTRLTGQTLILANAGASFAQIAMFDGAERLEAPRYLLAGASAEIQLPEAPNALRLRVAGLDGEQGERTIHAGGQGLSTSVR